MVAREDWSLAYAGRIIVSRFVVDELLTGLERARLLHVSRCVGHAASRSRPTMWWTLDQCECLDQSIVWPIATLINHPSDGRKCVDGV